MQILFQADIQFFEAALCRIISRVDSSFKTCEIKTEAKSQVFVFKALFCIH